MIEDDYRNWTRNKYGYSVTILNSQGNKLRISSPWKGYSEALDSVEVKTVRLKNYLTI